MDMTSWLRATPRLLVITARNGRPARLAVERLARERGWELAAAPADADLLVVCGAPGPGLGDAIERIWSQVPAPRARADVGPADGARDELDRAYRGLRGGSGAGHASVSSATEEARPEPGRGTVASAHEVKAHEVPADEVPADEVPADEVPGHEMSGHEMSGGHDMHMMHGGEVAGLPMADRAPDRDGLTLDVLQMSLGPVLSDWPAGLVVHVTLQGDVVQAARVEVVGEPGPAWECPPAAAALDGLAQLLAVCGSSTAARTARRLRDDVLAGTVDSAVLHRFARRLRRSRTLRWATDGLGKLDDGPDLAGDATARWLRWLDTAEHGGPAPDAGRAAAALTALAGLVEGRELASVRVVVASLDMDLDALMMVPG
ncbi:hypothetical protein GCM10017691_19140 [Pseudonocardia petroleophila]|uniref:Uncharacterized protein n=1 Tax=Pseudonocardia petroleophila TaxID=37331 RepID=A0A7G7MGZ7_9PSEU|nr:hypothetical protein [Pseudonocardia petroleophila]QNG52058.1 hypothetical protein H6H00_29020 [Pseudonocardia petroleophila]